MKPLFLTLAGAALGLALIADPAAAQRERPAGASGGSSAGAAVRGDSGGSARGGGSAGTYTAPSPSPSPSSGGSSGVYVPPSSGSSGAPYRGGGRTYGSGGASGRGAGYVQPAYGTAEDRAVPRGARPNPGTEITGQAVLRNPGGNDGATPPNAGHRPGYGYPGYGYSYPYYPYYPYNPYYFYGYGAFGLGYMYYDPFWWGYGPADWYGYGYGYGAGDPGYYQQAARGSLKLKVEPKTAEVYVDGYYMGVVDDFDGTFQKMELEAGAHRIEIRAEGYQTITFDVRIEPDDTVTYRGTLLSLSPTKR